MDNRNKKEQQLQKEETDRKFKIWAKISHDIRSPLSEIVGASQLMGLTSLDLEQKQYVKTIMTCGTYLNNIMTDFLDFSKLSVGKMVLNNEEFNIESCIEDCYDMIRIRAGEKDLELTYDVADNVPTIVISDKKKLKRIIDNILSNAIKFTDNGSISISVNVIHKTIDMCNISFSIADTGIGIKSEDIVTVFESFNQIHNDHTSHYDGTGLGLTICKEYVSLLGGNITVISTIGEGSEFLFDIVAKYKTVVQKINNVKILIVDEDICNRLKYLHMFKKWKIQPQLCESADEAIEYLKLSGFNLLFINSRLNGMGCKDLSSKAKQIQSNLKTIVSSKKIRNYSSFDAYLTLPMTSSNLYTTVQTLTENLAK